MRSREANSHKRRTFFAP